LKSNRVHGERNFLNKGNKLNIEKLTENEKPHVHPQAELRLEKC